MLQLKGDLIIIILIITIVTLIVTILLLTIIQIKISTGINKPNIRKNVWKLELIRVIKMNRLTTFGAPDVEKRQKRNLK